MRPMLWDVEFQEIFDIIFAIMERRSTFKKRRWEIPIKNADGRIAERKTR